MQISICAAVLVSLAVSAASAERKALKDIDTDKLTTETQQSAEPTEGMNLVWWIPAEFWKATLEQDQDMTERERSNVLGALHDYFVIAVVRADISELGEFRYHDRESVLDNLNVRFIDGADASQHFSPIAEDDLAGGTAVILGAMKPILTAAMGELGKNFHFFVYKNKNEEGVEIVSPYDRGQLKVELAKTPGDAGGVLTYDLPLDSLHVPRTCTKCSRVAHITWSYCPFCGTELAK